MNNEEINLQLTLMRNSIVSLHEHLAPDFKTKDLMFLKYGFSEKEIHELEKYIAHINSINIIPSKKEFRSKIAEIRELPEVTNQVLVDVLEGYKSDGLHVRLINKILN